MSGAGFLININTVDMELYLAQMALKFGASTEQIDKAKISALKYISKGMYKAGQQLVLAQYALKEGKARYKKNVRMSNPSRSRPYLMFIANGRVALHLADFKTKFTQKDGFSVQVLKSGRMTPFQKIMEHNGKARLYKSFRQRGKNSGKEMVASRDPERTASRGGEGVNVFFGPGLVPFLGKPENKELLMNGAIENFQKRFEHDLNAIMNGWTKAAKR